LIARAADGQPRNARARYNLGLLYQQLGRLDEARQALQAAVALEPGNGDYLFALGDHYLRRGQRQEALAVADRLIAAFPQDPAGAQLRAAALRR
jgi:predicted Zn-dependent protease